MAEKLETRSAVSYSRQYRRCGKPGCLVCGPGQPGHGPYWYAFWREGGRARSRYVGRQPPPDVIDAPEAASAIPVGAASAADPIQRPAPALRVQALGGFTVWLGDAVVPSDRWQRPMVAALFKALLGAPGHRLTGDQAIEALWPQATPEQGTARVRVTTHRLRRIVGMARLEHQGELLRLVPEAADATWLDADAFDAAAREALARHDMAACRAALALYGGEYLPEDRYAEWAVERREELRQRWLDLLLHAAALCEAAGEIEEAERHLQAVLAADRCQEAAAYALMRLHARAGRPAQALRVYRRLADALRDELDLAPEPRTRALHRALAARQPAPPSSPEPARPTNLPVPTTSFIGRQQALFEIRALLTGADGAGPDGGSGDRMAPCRLLTLVGPGGIGKTRLALAAADDLLDLYPDGVWLADLGPLVEPGQVAGTVVRAMRLEEEPGRPPLETLTISLRGKCVLLVLDNCEHLIDACADLAVSVLVACPAMRILATSRERLEVAGEHAWPVPPLSMPDDGEATAGRLPRSEAARLFLDRARAQRPDLALTDENAAAIARICSCVAGIPLAIELAAARAGVLGLEAIAARLGESMRLLAGGPRSAPSRQRTLRATLDWSWGLLMEDERTLLRRLAAFAGGWTLEAAEAVCADEPIRAEAVLDLLAGLGRKSLLLVDTPTDSYPAGEPRYGLLEMVRQYGLERLAEACEHAIVGRRHTAFYVALAEKAEPALRGADQLVWLGRLEAEHDNLRAALRRALVAREMEPALRLAGALQRFWWMRGYLREGLAWLREALALEDSGDADPAMRAPRAKVLHGAGWLAYSQGNLEEAWALAQQSLRLCEEGGDAGGLATALALLGQVAMDRGDYADATVLYVRSLGLRRVLGDRDGMASVLNLLGLVAMDQGDHGRSTALLGESLAIYRELRDRQGEATLLNNLGEVARYQGDTGHAATLYEHSLVLRRALQDSRGVAVCLLNLGLVAAQQGDAERAWALLADSLAQQRVVGDRFNTAYALEGLAVIAGRRGDAALAAQLGGAAAGLRDAIGGPLRPNDRPLYDAAMAAASAALGERGCAALWAAGRAMTWEQAAALALGEPDGGVASSSSARLQIAGRATGAQTEGDSEIMDSLARRRESLDAMAEGRARRFKKDDGSASDGDGDDQTDSFEAVDGQEEWSAASGEEPGGLESADDAASEHAGMPFDNPNAYEANALRSDSWEDDGAGDAAPFGNPNAYAAASPVGDSLEGSEAAPFGNPNAYGTATDREDSLEDAPCGNANAYSAVRGGEDSLEDDGPEGDSSAEESAEDAAASGAQWQGARSQGGRSGVTMGQQRGQAWQDAAQPTDQRSGPQIGSRRGGR